MVENLTLTEVRKALFTLYMNNEILADQELKRFTIDANNKISYNPKEFDFCSERMSNKYATYSLDDKRKVVPG